MWKWAVCATLLGHTARADELIKCSEAHGNVLVCAGEPIYGITVSPQDDGTYGRISWREYLGSDTKEWRDTALMENGHLHFIVEQGAQDASKWWSLSQWIFPRTQRLTIERHPNELRFEVTDSSGTVWTIAGTPAGKYDNGFVIEKVGAATQKARQPPKQTEKGVASVDFNGSGELFLEHHVASFSPYRKILAPEYLRLKSTFHDRKGATCTLVNKELFGDRADGKGDDEKFLFVTDDELADFLAKKCPKLDISPLRHPPVEPPPRRDYRK